MVKKMDFGATGQPIAELRVALRRYLIEFQQDLGELEAIGLDPDSCQKVKDQLRDAVSAFEKIDKGPHTVAVSSMEWAKRQRNDGGVAQIALGQNDVAASKASPYACKTPSGIFRRSATGTALRSNRAKGHCHARHR